MEKKMNFKDAFKVAVAIAVAGFLALHFDSSLSSLFPLCLIPINREREEAALRRDR
ncbi:MAG: hypothetical protein RBR20_13440 [Desulfobacterales bacterium]|nr:hypothetical protein [Desulfobacterales bacterium]